MKRPVLLRNMTRIGHWLDRQARRVAEAARDRKLPSRHQVIDGFILRGVRLHRDYVAQVIDTPTFVLFGGGFDTGAGLTIVYTAGAVGTRDDLVVPDNENEYTVKSSVGDYRNYLIQPLTAPDFTAQSTQAVFASNLQKEYLFEYGYFLAELAQSAAAVSFYALDDMNYFTFAQQAAVGCALTATFSAGVPLSFSEAGVPSFGTVGFSYLNSNSLWVKESDLPAGWTWHPRRQVQYTAYSPVNDPYRTRRSPGVMAPGFAVADAGNQLLTGVDTYCVAARSFKQYIGTFYESPPGEPYRPLYYDRDGEQSLTIVTGHYDRAGFAPGEDASAQIDTLLQIFPTDLPIAEIHPAPAVLPGNAWGKPDLPNFGRFLTPHVVPVATGFVTFAVYTAELDTNPDPDAPDGDLIGTAYALAIVLPDGSVETLRADWDSGPTAPLVPTAEAGILVVPAIVGAVAVDGVAYCLVWEHIYNRRETGDPDERGIGGRLVLYAATTTATRQVLSTAYAPLFASTMNRKPTVFDTVPYAADLENTFSSVCYIQGGKVVTAGVATPVAMPTSDTTSVIPEHDVLCLEIDPLALTCAPKGVIETRTRLYRKSILSAPRPFTPAAGADPETPAVLLAGCTDHLQTNRGAGKTYISYDGGENWREYVSDAGGQSGAFYVGNKLWWFDATRPLTIGGE